MEGESCRCTMLTERAESVRDGGRRESTHQATSYLPAQTYVEPSLQQQVMGGQPEIPAGQGDRARDYRGITGLRGVRWVGVV